MIVFKINPEDLMGLDKSTQSAIQPLLEALNSAFIQANEALAAIPNEQVIEMTISTGNTVASTFPIRFKTNIQNPKFITIYYIPTDPDHSLSTAFVMQGFRVSDTGLVTIPNITGLASNKTYRLTFLVRS